MKSESICSRGRLARTARITVAAVAFVALAGCEGTNVFDGSLSLPRATIAAPDVVLAGDTFFVRVDGYAPRGITRLDFSLRGTIMPPFDISLRL